MARAGGAVQARREGAGADPRLVAAASAGGVEAGGGRAGPGGGGAIARGASAAVGAGGGVDHAGGRRGGGCGPPAGAAGAHGGGTGPAGVEGARVWEEDCVRARPPQRLDVPCLVASIRVEVPPAGELGGVDVDGGHDDGPPRGGAGVGAAGSTGGGDGGGAGEGEEGEMAGVEGTLGGGRVEEGGDEVRRGAGRGGERGAEGRGIGAGRRSGGDEADGARHSGNETDGGALAAAGARPAPHRRGIPKDDRRRRVGLVGGHVVATAVGRRRPRPSRPEGRDAQEALTWRATGPRPKATVPRPDRMSVVGW